MLSSSSESESSELSEGAKGIGRASPFAWMTGASRSGVSIPRAWVGEMGPFG